MNLRNRFVKILSHSESIRLAFIEDEDGLASSRRNLLGGNFLGNMFSCLISGVFLTGLILHMLGDESVEVQNSFLGSVTMISLAAGLSQLVAPMLWERFPKRKKLLLILRVIYHLVNIIGLGLVPMLPFTAVGKTRCFLGMHLVACLIANICSPAFSVWHVSDIPLNLRAHYFSTVNMLSPIITAVLSTLSSFLIDGCEAIGYKYAGLLFLRGVAFLFGLLEIRCFAHMVELPYAPSEKKNPLAMLVLPFKTPRYLLTILLIMVYSFGANFPGSYFTAYLLDDVGLSYALISGLSLFQIPINLISYPAWNRVIRRIGWLKTLSISTVLYMTPYILNALTTADHKFLFVLSCLSAYFLSPGISLVFSNLPYMNVPKANQTSYIAFYSTASSLSGFLGSTCSKVMMTATSGVPLLLFGVAFQNRQFVNFIPCIFLVLTSLTATLVRTITKKHFSDSDEVEA